MISRSDTSAGISTEAFWHCTYPDGHELICFCANVGVPILDATLEGVTVVPCEIVETTASSVSPIAEDDPIPPTVCVNGVKIAEIPAPIDDIALAPAPCIDVDVKTLLVPDIKVFAILDKLGEALPRGIVTPVDPP